MVRKKDTPLKIRQIWTRNPVEKVKESAKIYKRKKKPIDTEDKYECTSEHCTDDEIVNKIKL